MQNFNAVIFVLLAASTAILARPQFNLGSLFGQPQQQQFQQQQRQPGFQFGGLQQQQQQQQLGGQQQQFGGQQQQFGVQQHQFGGQQQQFGGQQHQQQSFGGGPAGPPRSFGSHMGDLPHIDHPIAAPYNPHASQQFRKPAPHAPPPHIGGKGIIPKVEGNVQNVAAGAGLAGAGLFAFSNLAKGNDNVRVNPTLGLNYNHKTGSFAPTLSANVQVGDGPIAPTFNFGGQLDERGLAPVVGSGFNVAGKDGKFSPSLNSGFVLRDGEAQGVVGGGIGYNNAFNFGNVGGLLG